MKNHHLQTARERRKWTQQDLADKLGITKLTVGRWERGEAEPHRTYRDQLCILFDLSEQELGFSPRTQASPSHAALYDSAIPLLPATPLVGREKELAQIKHRFYSGESVALTSTALNGIPGVGKTALAIALAHNPELRAHFHDGILWAPLGPQANVQGILNRWGHLLGITASLPARERSETKAQRLRAALNNKAMLIVLDDVWHLEDAAALSVGGSQCSYLVTTRFPQIATQVAMKGATMVRELSEEDSLLLLQFLASGVIERDPQKARSIVQLVGGLPLALTLIGNYLRRNAYSGPSRRITTAMERLMLAEERLRLSEPHLSGESHPSLPARTPVSLHDILAVTHDRLSIEAQAMLHALSILPAKPGSFSEETAIAVSGCATEALDELMDTGFLEHTDVDRYQLHQIIRDYALLHVQGTQTHTRLILHMTEFVAAHQHEYQVLAEESDVIFIAIDYAHQHNKQAEFLQMVCLFTPFLIVQGLYTRAEGLLQQAHTIALARGTVMTQARILLYLGQIAHMRGWFHQARAYLQEGLLQARAVSAYALMCEVLAELGPLARREGDFVQATVVTQEGIALARRVGPIEVLSRLIEVHGSILNDQGDYKEAEPHLQEALALAKALQNPERIASILTNLSYTAACMGDLEQAEAYLQEGLTHARHITHRDLMCVLLYNLGEVHYQQKNYEQAEPYIQEALQLARFIDAREWTCMALRLLGGVRTEMQDYSEAERILQEALELARQIGSPRVLGAVLDGCGNLALARNHLEMAKAYFQEMLLVPSSQREIIASAHYGLAQVAAAHNELQTAHTHGETSLEMFHQMGHGRTKEVAEWLASLPSS